jgi:hypothetical protein
MTRTSWWAGLCAWWRGAWAVTGGPVAPAAVVPQENTARFFPRLPCPRCGLFIAHSRGGEWTWPHACADGYGAVSRSGRFEARQRRREPVLPIDGSTGPRTA